MSWLLGKRVLVRKTGFVGTVTAVDEPEPGMVRIRRRVDARTVDRVVADVDDIQAAPPEAAEATRMPAADDWRFRAMGREWMGQEINHLPTGKVTLTAVEVVEFVAELTSAEEVPAPEPLSDERLLANAMDGDADDLSRDELAAFHRSWKEKDGCPPGHSLEKANRCGSQAAGWKDKYESLRERLQAEIKNCRLAATLRRGQPEKMAAHVVAVTSLERVLSAETIAGGAQ